MNFLSHALPYLEDPLIAISTGVPDWLSVVDRKIRAREKMARRVLDHQDSNVRKVAAGIIHHIDDDRWFHATGDFVESNLQLAVSLRDLLPGDQGFRPMFVSHIVIEILLDALWIRDDPDCVDRYYEQIRRIDAEVIQYCVNEVTGKSTTALADLIRRYEKSRFLLDYLDPDRLLFRLNQVMRRVGLAELPESIVPWLRDAEDLVESRRLRLMTRPDGTSHFPLP